MKFTDKGISNLKPREKMYQLRESKGFGIRVLPSGLKQWIYVYTFDGRRRQMNLGQYPTVSLADARTAHATAYAMVKDKNNPRDPQEERDRLQDAERQAREEHRLAPTVSDLADEYMRRHAKVNKRESSWREDERLLKKDVLPAWGEFKAAEIRRRDCRLLLESFQDRPALCNNILKLTRKMFNFAVEQEILEFSPFVGVKAPVKVTHRERILSEAEIKVLWNVGLPKAAMSEEVRRILQLILVTGQRPGEVAGIHVREIEGNWWTIPADRAKNRTSHRVYLTKTARQLLGSAEGYFFPSPRQKEGQESHIDENAVAYAIRRNLKNYQPRRPIKGNTVRMVEVEEAKKMNLAHFTPHDLRRTAATFLAKLGFMDETIDAVLGHKKSGIIKVYNRHKYDAEKQAAMVAWEHKLKDIVEGRKGAGVTPISAGKKRA